MSDEIITDDELNTLLGNLELKFIAQKLKVENVDKSIITLLKIIKNLQQENKKLREDVSYYKGFIEPLDKENRELRDKLTFYQNEFM